MCVCVYIYIYIYIYICNTYIDAYAYTQTRTRTHTHTHTHTSKTQKLLENFTLTRKIKKSAPSRKRRGLQQPSTWHYPQPLQSICPLATLLQPRPILLFYLHIVAFRLVWWRKLSSFPVHITSPPHPHPHFSLSIYAVRHLFWYTHFVVPLDWKESFKDKHAETCWVTTSNYHAIRSCRTLPLRHETCDQVRGLHHVVLYNRDTAHGPGASE